MSRSGRRIAASALVLVASVLLAGCFALPVDDGFATAIPAALEDAPLGLSDVWAEKGGDGLTSYLAVGADSDADALDAAGLQEIVEIIVDESTFTPDGLRLTLDGPAGPIALVDLAVELGADPVDPDGTGLALRWPDAELIADGGR